MKAYLGLGAIGVVLLLGCDSQDNSDNERSVDAGPSLTDESDRFGLLQSEGAQTWVASEDPEVSGAAAIGGVLMVTEGDCIALGNETTGPVDIVVWPSGTTLLDDGTGVSVPGTGDILTGDELSAGGAYGEPDRSIDLPAQCVSDSESNELAYIGPGTIDIGQS